MIKSMQEKFGSGHQVTALYEIVPINSNSHDGIELKYQSNSKKKVLPKITNESEILTLKLRYKEPKEHKSKLLSKVLYYDEKSFEQASSSMRFASSVASLAMYLKGTYGLRLSLDDIKSIIPKSEDTNQENKHELIKLINQAKQFYNQ